jgi:hypothetical protein
LGTTYLGHAAVIFTKEKTMINAMKVVQQVSKRPIYSAIQFG